MTHPTDHQNAFAGMNYTELTDAGSETDESDGQARLYFCSWNHCHPMRTTCESYDGLRLISYGRWRKEDE